MKKEFHTWEIQVEPLLPAREVVVAYLGDCGFSMFESIAQGVVAHGEVGEVDESLADACLNEIRAFAEVSVSKRLQQQQNWNARWEADYPVVVVTDDEGQALCTIRAPFHHPPEAGMDVLIQPQMSFGTGHHATTYLMTKFMFNHVRKGSVVLDMGCGTGVLAIVAHKLGAAQVLGIDIESDAVSNSEENVKLNGGSLSAQGKGAIVFREGSGGALQDMPDSSWDIICANIHKNVLMDCMASFSRVLSEGGSLFLSGFFEGDVPILEDSVRRNGLALNGVAIKEGWACMHCGKPST